MESVALTLERDDVGVSQEPIQDGGSRRDVAKELAPVFGEAIGRDDDRATFVATDDDFCGFGSPKRTLLELRGEWKR
jgi:hypothetical protein